MASMGMAMPGGMQNGMSAMGNMGNTVSQYWKKNIAGKLQPVPVWA